MVPPVAARLYQGLWRTAEPLVRRSLRRRVGRGELEGARVVERFGQGAPGPPDAIWLHSAGRGEAIASRALILGLREAGYEGPILATTFSPSGVPLFEGLAGVHHRFAPLDDRRWVARFLDAWSPRLGVVLEADVWPNLVWEATARGVPMALCSARISPRSLRRWRPLARSVFPRFEVALTTDEEQARRFALLGVPVTGVVGCLKAAAEPLPVDGELAAALRAAAAGRPVVVAASTHEGEEELVAGALEGVEALVVLAPRYAARGAALADAFGARRRSLSQPPGPDDRLWIADSMGELGSLFAAADLVIVGGSFGSRGGHNPAEPARFGRPIVTGPDQAANAATTAALVEAGGALQVERAALAPVLADLLRDDARRRAMGEAAAEVAMGWERRRRTAAERLLTLGHPGVRT